MKKTFKLILVLQLTLGLIAPTSYLPKDTLSPRSIMKKEKFIALFRNFAVGENTDIGYITDSKSYLTSDQRRDQVFKRFHNGLLTPSDLEWLNQYTKTEDSPYAFKINLNSKAELMGMKEGIEQARLNLFKDPEDEAIMTNYLRASERNSNRDEAIEKYINDYLKYYSKIKNSPNPFELKNLHKQVSPEDIRKYIEKNIKKEDLEYLQLEFLFAEMIRRLKLEKHYSPHTWPKDESESLHKKNIFDHIFKTLLADYENIPALKEIPRDILITLESQETIDTTEYDHWERLWQEEGETYFHDTSDESEEEEEEAETTLEDSIVGYRYIDLAMSRLEIFILFHLLGIDGLTKFSTELEQEDFKTNFNRDDPEEFLVDLPALLIISTGALGKTSLKNADLRHANLTNFSFDDINLNESDLRYADLSNARIGNVTFENSDFRYSKLKKFKLLEVGEYDGPPAPVFTRIDLRGTNIEEIGLDILDILKNVYEMRITKSQHKRLGGGNFYIIEKEESRTEKERKHIDKETQNNATESLKTIMTERNLSVKDVAKMTGLSTTTINRLMTHWGNPKITTIEKLTVGLGISAETFKSYIPSISNIQATETSL